MALAQRFKAGRGVSHAYTDMKEDVARVQVFDLTCH
jgi:hypothetical protein